MPSPIPATDAPQRTWAVFPHSYIQRTGEPEEPWCWAFPTAPASFIVFTPPREPLSPADLRAAMLHGETYLASALDAQIAGDAAGVRAALEVLAAIVQVAIAQLHKSSSSENRVLQ